MYRALLKHVQEVEAALEDVHALLKQQPDFESEWFAIVQNVLKADSGWEYVLPCSCDGS